MVLTKADKRESSAATHAVQKAFRESGCSVETPIVYTSSVSRKGREAMWRFLRRVADPAHYERLLERQSAAKRK